MIMNLDSNRNIFLILIFWSDINKNEYYDLQKFVTMVSILYFRYRLENFFISYNSIALFKLIEIYDKVLMCPVENFIYSGRYLFFSFIRRMFATTCIFGLMLHWMETYHVRIRIKEGFVRD